MARVMIAEEILTVPRLYRVLKAHSLAAAFLSWEQTNRPVVKELLQQAVRTAFLRWMRTGPRGKQPGRLSVLWTR